MTASQAEFNLEDRLKLQEVIARYCHGVDRLDLDILMSAYWEDGTHDFGDGPIPAQVFCEAVTGALKEMVLTQHVTSNSLFAFQDETRATGQTYCVAYHQAVEGSENQEIVVGGRYLDQFEKRHGVWRIKSRLYIMDWNRNDPSSMMSSGGMYDGIKSRGKRAPDDPSSAYLKD